MGHVGRRVGRLLVGRRLGRDGRRRRPPHQTAADESGLERDPPDQLVVDVAGDVGQDRDAVDGPLGPESAALAGHLGGGRIVDRVEQLAGVGP